MSKILISEEKFNQIALKMEKEEEHCIYNELMKSDKGHADLFVEEYKESIKIISKNDAYVYNYTTCLWETKTCDYLLNIISYRSF
jgi:hypothetical protein